MDNKRLMVEFERNLGSDWDVWLTVTFRERTLMENASRRFKSFFKHLNKPNEIFFHKYIIAWAFFEKETRGGVHVHALIRGISSGLVSKLEKYCRNYFGIARVIPYDRSLPVFKSATHYLANKYPSLSLEGYDYYRINSKFRKTGDARA